MTVQMRKCTKCGGSRFNGYDSCMDCRNMRGRVRAERIKTNGGTHTTKEWKALLLKSPTCAVCSREWTQVKPRLDTRYKFTWTKGHKIPIYHGGSDDISNIQAECYECNFKKNAGKLKAS